MYLDLDSPNTFEQKEYIVAGFPASFEIPHTVGEWSFLRLDIGVLNGELVNAYTLEVVNLSTGPVKAGGSTWEEEHSLTSYSQISVAEVNGILVVTVGTSIAAMEESSSLQVSVGSATTI